jgi:hypothetical protein
MRQNVRKREEMDVPGFNFHQLSGTRAGTYGVQVTGPWCLIFEWDGTDAIRVDREQWRFVMQTGGRATVRASQWKLRWARWAGATLT